MWERRFKKGALIGMFETPLHTFDGYRHKVIVPTWARAPRHKTLMHPDIKGLYVQTQKGYAPKHKRAMRPDTTYLHTTLIFL